MLEYTFSLANFEILILILVRISCFVYIAPFFGQKNAPSQAKIGFSFLLHFWCMVLLIRQQSSIQV